jgi:hypothetical protein
MERLPPFTIPPVYHFATRMVAAISTLYSSTPKQRLIALALGL